MWWEGSSSQIPALQHFLTFYFRWTDTLAHREQTAILDSSWLTSKNLSSIPRWIFLCQKCTSLKCIRAASFADSGGATRELEQRQTADNADTIVEPQINLPRLYLRLTAQLYTGTRLGWQHLVVLLWGEDFVLCFDNEWVQPLHLSDMAAQTQTGGGCSWKLALTSMIRLYLTTVITTQELQWIWYWGQKE